MQNFTHKSVLLEESIHSLMIQPEGIYVDLTFGRGGHSSQILAQLSLGRLIAFDKDPEAIEYGKTHCIHPQLTLVHSDFSKVYSYAVEHNLCGKIDGILLDLGVSSPQLDDKSRGFSFMEEAYLDMRMDISKGIDAKTWLEQMSETEIAHVLYTYGEEKKSRMIAKKIKEFQAHTPLETTKQLSDIVESVVYSKNKHPATRTFQAIRIAVNNELKALEQFLEHAAALLRPSGMLSIITFHSLEDRIVKQYFQNASIPPYVPKHLPPAEFTPIFSHVKKIKPSPEEIAHNPRSRSALLRYGARC